MKHVSESLNQFYDYKFFKVFEEDTKAELKDREQDGLAAVERAKKNFEDFKKDAKGEILRFKDFWEENLKNKENFTEGSDVYKFFDGNYCVGIFNLPVETLSDGRIDGGFGAEEGGEEIIEGPEIGGEEGSTDFFEEQEVGGTPVNEAEEDEFDLDLDLGDEEGDEEGDEGEDLDLGGDEGDDLDLGGDEGEDLDVDMGAEEAPVDDMSDEMPVDDMSADVSGDDSVNLTEDQTYFVVYDMSGGEREEIFRCGSNNVVNAFKEFYNDTFKGAMKQAIVDYKEQKKQEKLEAEKSEKKKRESDKDSKLKKFLSERQRSYLKTAHKLNESVDDDKVYSFTWDVAIAVKKDVSGDYVIDDNPNDPEEAYEFLNVLEENGVEYKVVDPNGPSGWPEIEFTGTKKQLIPVMVLLNASGYDENEIAEMIKDWDGDQEEELIDILA